MTDWISAIGDKAHWWHGIAAAGLAICLACIAAGWENGALGAAGLAAFGVGQWRDHPIQQRIMQPGMGIGTGIVTSYPWAPSPLGVTFTVIGAILGLYAFVRHLWL